MPTDVPGLTNIIIKSLYKTIGKATIKTGKQKTVTNKEVKEAKANRKLQKKLYHEAIKTRQVHEINSAKSEYIKSQQLLRLAIDKCIAEDTKESIQNITKGGNRDMEKFWATRRKILGKPKEEYDILDDDNNPINNPTHAKKHIADYFENLYQAREGDELYKEWTEQIENTVEKATRCPNGESLDEITIYELDSAIKQLQRRKAVGPDDIPNEALIESGKKMRKKILCIFNNIYRTEEIPQTWRQGKIIRIYKGKGKKGQCSNERGITPSSNLGKLFERIINNKILGKINMSECQGGGKKALPHLTTRK